MPAMVRSVAQQARRGLLPPKVDERCRRDRPVLIEALRECCALVFGLEIGVLSRGAHHLPILAAFGRRQRRRCLSCAKLESCDDGAMTDRMAVTDWVARYERAWRSPGTDALDELFTHGVVLRPRGLSRSTAWRRSGDSGMPAAAAPTSGSGRRARSWRSTHRSRSCEWRGLRRRAAVA
jgi:hypothetical protein